MRRLKNFSVLLVLLLAMAALFGCNDVKINKTYKHYLYNGFDSQFFATGNKIEFYENYIFTEFLARKEGSEVMTPHELKGNYVYDKKEDVLYGEFFSQSFKEFKKSYKKELVATGVSSYVADLMCNSLSTKTTYHKSGSEVFKVSAVQGSRRGLLSENLNTIEGIYGIKGFTSTGSELVMFKRGKIYLPSNAVEETDTSKYVYDIETGTYSVSGKFLTVSVNNSNSSKIPKKQKYMLATITLPELTADMIGDEYGDKTNLKENALVQAISLKKIKVFVLDFYSTAKF